MTLLQTHLRVNGSAC